MKNYLQIILNITKNSSTIIIMMLALLLMRPILRRECFKQLMIVVFIQIVIIALIYPLLHFIATGTQI